MRVANKGSGSRRVGVCCVEFAENSTIRFLVGYIDWGRPTRLFGTTGFQNHRIHAHNHKSFAERERGKFYFREILHSNTSIHFRRKLRLILVFFKKLADITKTLYACNNNNPRHRTHANTHTRALTRAHMHFTSARTCTLEENCSSHSSLRSKRRHI